MKVFVAGATGVLGRRAVPLLVGAGHEVTAVGRTPEKRWGLERAGARAVAVDLFDRDAVGTAVRGTDAIVNLATAVPPGFRALWPGAWREMDRVRRGVSRTLVDAALAQGVERVIQEAFAPIYEDGGDAWLDEHAPLRPASYNRAVLDAEAQAARFTRAGATGVVLRFGLLYGPGDPNTRQIVDGIRRGWFPLFGRPDGYLSLLAQDDGARAVVAALGVPAGVYNVVEEEPLRRREFAAGVADLLGVRPPRFLPAVASRLAGSVGETLGRSLRISNRAFERVARWRPRYPTAVQGFDAVIAERLVTSAEVRALG